MRKVLLTGLLAAAGMAAASVTSLAAESVAAFYDGKQIRVISAGGPGGSHGVYAQLLAPAIERLIPGNPTVVVQYMPGGGGTRAANYLYNAAPKDGTVLGTMLNGVVTTSAIGGPGVKYDATRLQWIGGAETAVNTISVLKSTGVRTLEDAKQKEIILSASGRGSDSYLIPMIANAMLGTRFKVVTGYRGIARIDQAVDKGEAQGRAATWQSIKTLRRHWIERDLIAHLAVVGLKPEPDLPGVPLLSSFAKTDQDRAIVGFVSGNVLFGRTWVAPPGVPAERIDALRKAFEGALADPETVRAIKARGFDVQPIPWQRLAAVTARVHRTDAAVLDRIRGMMGRK